MKNKLRLDKLMMIIFLLCVLQVVFVLILAANRVVNHIVFNNRVFDFEDLSLVAVFVVMVSFFYALFRVAVKIKQDKEKTLSQQDMIKNMQDMNRKIGSQRHDFLNHLQIVYSLIELKEYDDAEKYLETLYGEIEKVNKFLKTEDAALNALLQAKYNDALRRGIDIEFNMLSGLHGTNIKSIDLCRIFANLIDNAIFAAKDFSGVKKIVVTISEKISCYEFCVENSGENIPLEILPKLFNSGFSTKGGKGEGFGLYIVKKTVDEYNGSIDVVSNNCWTKFSIVIKLDI